MPASSGQLRRTLTFSSRAAGSVDEYGNVSSEGFTERFETRARVVPRLGGEQVLAARQAGTNIVTITVRAGANTRQITTDWIAEDKHTGEVYNIRSAVPDERGQFIEMLGEEGVAT